MNARRTPKRWHLGVIGVVASVALMTGCARVPTAQAAAAIPETSMSPGTEMPSGMSMSPGESMPSMAAAGSSADPVSPSASAKMVCSPDTQASVAAMLGLASVPAPTATFVNRLYSCTYHLSWGPLVLVVKEATGVPAARAYFDSLRNAQRTAAPLSGVVSLGLPAFETQNGTVAFLKDDKILQVDASAMTAQIGAQRLTRSGVAYQIATDVLGCWNGE